MDATLIATLGAEPQVVTLATALLLEQHVHLTAVLAVHTRPEFPPIAQALPALRVAFAGLPGWPSLQSVEAPIDDVLTPLQFDVFATVLYRVLQVEVIAGHQLHLLLAGGRKPMALIGMSIAQLLLGEADHVWYLHSNDDLRQSGRFFPQHGDQVELISMPLATISAVPPRLTQMAQASDPATARQFLSASRRQQLRNFVRHELTPAEREVAALAVQDVLTVREMAAILNKAPKTITNQLNIVYSKLESTFGLQPDLGVKREFLRRELEEYFAEIGSQIP